MKFLLPASILLSATFATAQQPHESKQPKDLPDLAWGAHCLFRVYPAVGGDSAAAITTSRDGRRFYWSLGDITHGEILGRTDLLTGETERIELAPSRTGERVKNGDWEAMATDDDGQLWIVDAGANNFHRESFDAYEVNPDDPVRPLRITRHIKITYPHTQPQTEGADTFSSVIEGIANQHPQAQTAGQWISPDVEAAFIHDHKLYTIEKASFGPIRVYQAGLAVPPGAFPPAETAARLIGTLSPSATKSARLFPIIFITDASLLGGEVYLLTYFGVYHCPLEEFVKAAENPRPGTVIAQGKIEFDFPIIGSQFAPKQAEGLVAISTNEFLISREDGRVFKWKDGRCAEPAVAPPP